jgi:hypothetical protein
MPATPAAFERWLRCAPKACCAAAVVYPTGDEALRIATTLAIPLDEVVTALPSSPLVTAYRLKPGGPAFRLALVRVRTGPQAPATCGFLVQLPNGTGRCGLGELRPRRCQAFPAVMRAEEIGIDGTACTCAIWSAADLAPEAEGAVLRDLVRANERYAALVGAWNARLTTDATHAAYLTYLQKAYAA